MGCGVKRACMSVWTCGLVIIPFMSATAADGTPLAERLKGGAEKHLTTFKDIIEAGGPAMQVILCLSVVMTFLVILFLFTLRRNALFPKRFVQEAMDAADEGDTEALEAICHDSDSPASKIIGAAVEQMAGEQRVDYMVVRDAIEDEGGRQTSVLWQRIQYLQDIAVVAPMVGLLGTVLGMLESFAGMRTGLGDVGIKPEMLARGVSKALITTAGGLVVGILAMILYAIFRGRVNKLIAGLESACSGVLRRFMLKNQFGKY